MKTNEKICHPSQFGGIETSVLDNGAGRGVRIAWINTGSGLRYKVVIDRGLDIADAFYNQYGLAWISKAGIRPPEMAAMYGLEWLRTWGGGLVTTCGIGNMGIPDGDETGERGLHGRISNIPAEIVSIRQPDPAIGINDFSISGIVRESKVFGPHLELERTISGTLGEPVIRIQDRVTNRGNSPAPHMMLYHCNFGWPLIDEGTRLNWNGSWKSRGNPLDDAIFHKGGTYRLCPGPLDEHKGTGKPVHLLMPCRRIPAIAAAAPSIRQSASGWRSGSGRISCPGLSTGSTGVKANMLPDLSLLPTIRWDSTAPEAMDP